MCFCEFCDIFNNTFLQNTSERLLLLKLVIESTFQFDKHMLMHG